jgi:ferredoxin-NADP reductase
VHTITFVNKQPHTPDICTYWFKPYQPLDYLPGQYVEVTVEHAPADERGPKRWFTLWSSPTEDLLAITTRHTPGGSSFKQALAGLNPGQVIQISEAMGDFVLPKDETVELLFVVAGIGITPIRSMAKWLIDSGSSRPVTVLYAGRSFRDFVATTELAKAHFHVQKITENPPADWPGTKGKLGAHNILELATKKPLIYISGAEPMVKDLQSQLIAASFPAERIIIDDFPGYTTL